MSKTEIAVLPSTIPAHVAVGKHHYLVEGLPSKPGQLRFTHAFAAKKIVADLDLCLGYAEGRDMLVFEKVGPYRCSEPCAGFFG